MILQLLLLLVIQFGLVAGALAGPTKPTGEALRQVVSGRTVLIETPIGSFPIRYKGDGTMAGQAPLFVASLGTQTDAGSRGPRAIVFASAGADGWTPSHTASGCDASAPRFIGCAMTACRAQPRSACP
jgi:hypothetical protein